ncbi:hypothetical protein [Bacteroides cellulosilyticus]|uniref:hypothetical protein n=1 Tax=Bacteroides cellulosilyticus TaxID=246787 RepID=UPI00101C6B23|nr:hypothetical protein [Bacteroides cellulosilyticus]
MGRIVGYSKFLKASTVVEVVVASVIFMLMFCLSLEVLTKMNQNGKSTEMLQVIMDRNEFVQQVSAGNLGYGNYMKSFDWGEIHVKIQPHMKHKYLRDIHFTGKMKSGKKLFEYRFLKEYEAD